MRKAWTTDPVSFEGRHSSERSSRASQTTAARRDPTGSEVYRAGARRVARLGDGMAPDRQSPAAIAPAGRVRAKAKQNRRLRTGGWKTSPVDHLDAPGAHAGPSAREKSTGRRSSAFPGHRSEVRADVERYAALGVAHFVFDPTVPDPKCARNMKRFATSQAQARRARRSSVISHAEALKLIDTPLDRPTSCSLARRDPRPRTMSYRHLLGRRSSCR